MSNAPLRALFAALAAASACAEPRPPEAPPARLGSDGYLAVEGANLLYGTRGSGPPLVLLHGGPGIGSGYLVLGLSIDGFPPEGYRLVVYDQRGSGRSTGVENPSLLTIDRFVEDLEAVRRATGEERMALLGHSFGGLVALEYAIRYPSRVMGMLLVDPDPASRALWARFEEITAARRTPEDQAAMDSIASVDGWQLDPVEVEAYQLVRLRSYFGRREVAPNLVLGLQYGVYGNFPTTADSVRSSLGDWDLFGQLGGIQAPTLILTGDASPFPPEAHERLRDALPNARLVVMPGVGHFPFMEAPEAFVQDADAFFAGLLEPDSVTLR